MNKIIIIIAVFFGVLISVDAYTGIKFVSPIKKLGLKRDAKKVVRKKKLARKTGQKSYYQKMRKAMVNNGLQLVNTLKMHKKKLLLLSAGAYATSDTWMDKLKRMVSFGTTNALEAEPLFGKINPLFKDGAGKVKIASRDIVVEGEDFSLEFYKTTKDGYPFVLEDILEKEGNKKLIQTILV